MQKTVNFKKGVAFVVAIVMVCAVFAGIAVYNSRTEDAFAAGETVIVLQIDNPIMTVNGAETEIDPGRGTTPLIIGDRTLVPIRAIIEAAGGEVEWDDAAQQVTLTYNGDVIRLVIHRVPKRRGFDSRRSADYDKRPHDAADKVYSREL